LSLDESFLEKLRALSPERQREGIDFVEFLHKKTSSREPRKSLAGLWADLNVDITDEDIADARRECWSNFPREDF
jgi:hypothetical protein